MKIVDLIDQDTAYDPESTGNELMFKGIHVKPSAVYNVLKRHNQNTRKLRLENILIKQGLAKISSDLERARDKAKTRSLKMKYPGHIAGMDVFNVGCLKGIYQYTGIDTYASFCRAKLYSDKIALSACFHFKIYILQYKTSWFRLCRFMNNGLYIHTSVLIPKSLLLNYDVILSPMGLIIYQFRGAALFL